MPVEIDIQYATNEPNLPNEDQIRLWARTALRKQQQDVQLTIRIVDQKEGAQLNERWRKSKGATNVLSFQNTGISGVVSHLLGDIVICAAVVAREANQQNKDFLAHWAHVIIHGVLHLMGFEHEAAYRDAERMEKLEIQLLKQLDYGNPYII